VRTNVPRPGRREPEQRTDGVPGTADAPCFEDEGQGEKKGDSRRFEPLADADGAQNGDGHQQVHVCTEATERSNGFGEDEPSARKHRDKIERDRQGREKMGLASPARRKRIKYVPMQKPVEKKTCYNGNAANCAHDGAAVCQP